MRRHDLLAGLHERLQPRTYLEIGVNTGLSLGLSRTRTIGVDPYFHLTKELRCDVHLVRTTSDEFFAREHPLAHFPEPVVDLAFIDGMHLAEFALRDFMNVERHTHAASVVVFDDMLPRDVDEAAREREYRGAWAGDVYKVTESLRALRPDLVVLEVDTTPTGTLVVLLPDRTSEVLHRGYDDLVEEYVVPDPQKVPDAILDRRRAVAPGALLASPIWDTLRSLRTRPDDEATRAKVRDACASAGLATP